MLIDKETFDKFKASDIEIGFSLKDELFISWVAVNALKSLSEKMPDDLYAIQSSVNDEVTQDVIDVHFYYYWPADRAVYPLVLTYCELERDKPMGLGFGSFVPNLRLTEGGLYFVILAESVEQVKKIKRFLRASVTNWVFDAFLFNYGITVQTRQLESRGNLSTPFTYSTLVYFSETLTLPIRVEGLTGILEDDVQIIEKIEVEPIIVRIGG
ncbi:MAG: hypothetical protein QXY76_03370 [Nitrososphaeria archaeon]